MATNPPNRKQLRFGPVEKKCAGLGPEGTGPPTRRRRQPASGERATASNCQSGREFHRAGRFRNIFRQAGIEPAQPLQKGRPRLPKGPGSIAGWVRGWGLGGTPPGVGYSTCRMPAGSCPTKLFSRRGPAVPVAAAPALARRLHRPAARPGVRRETPNIANGCGKVADRRRDLRRRSACLPETNRAGELTANPRQSSFGNRCASLRKCGSRKPETRRPPQCRIRATVPRHRGESRGLLCVAVDRA